MRPKQSITQADVARELNISVVTVSNALAGRKGVSDALREKVFRKAAEIGYLDSTSEAEKEYIDRIGIVGLCPFELEDLAADCRIDLVTIEEKDLGSALCEREGVSTIVLCGSEAGEAWKSARAAIDAVRSGIYVIGYGFYDRSIPIDFVAEDGFHSVQYPVRELKALGHRGIAYLTWEDTFKDSASLDRFLGFRMAMEDDLMKISRSGAGIHWDKTRRITWEKLSETIDRIGRETFDAWAEFWAEPGRIRLQSDMPQAWICEDSALACKAIHRLREIGIRVPEDISIVGYGEPDVKQQRGVPALSYFAEDGFQMAGKCLSLSQRSRVKTQSDGHVTVGCEGTPEPCPGNTPDRCGTPTVHWITGLFFRGGSIAPPRNTVR